MRCPTCGRLDRKEISANIKKGIAKRINTGSRRRFDHQAIRDLFTQENLTVGQIALLTGASVSTVSKVINKGANK